MSNNLAPRFEFERVLKHVFGSTSTSVLLHGLGLLTLFGMFTDALSNIFSQFVFFGGGDSKEPFKLATDVFAIALFPAYLAWIWQRARRTSPWKTPRVISDESPAQVRGLVLFLSPPGPKDSSRIFALIHGQAHGELHDKQFPATFEGPWRMALEGIACHLPRLEFVVVIGSATVSTEAGNKEGTTHRIPQFVNLLHALDGGTHLTVESLSDAMRSIPGQEKWVERWRDGVDFEDVQALLEAIEAAYQTLESRGLAGYEIGVDVTGGQKTTTIAGAIATLAIGRHCQYVSMHDHTVKSFDVTYFD